MTLKIHGIQNHPDKEKLSEYSSEVPAGTHIVRLDDQAWGKSSNLFCYFTEISSGNQYRLGVFNRSDYEPYKGELSFKEETPGTQYEITTDVSRNGLSKFEKAVKLETFDL